jgi:hypothetical protein
MRTVALVLLVLGVATALDVRPGVAQTYRPWCAVYSGSGGSNCGFTSYEQCRMTATPGSGAFCTPNAWYLYYGKRGSTGQGSRSRSR